MKPPFVSTLFFITSWKVASRTHFQPTFFQPQWSFITEGAKSGVSVDTFFLSRVSQTLKKRKCFQLVTGVHNSKEHGQNSEHPPTPPHGCISQTPSPRHPAPIKKICAIQWHSKHSYHESQRRKFAIFSSTIFGASSGKLVLELRHWNRRRRPLSGAPESLLRKCTCSNTHHFQAPWLQWRTETLKILCSSLRRQ